MKEVVAGIDRIVREAKPFKEELKLIAYTGGVFTVANTLGNYLIERETELSDNSLGWYGMGIKALGLGIIAFVGVRYLNRVNGQNSQTEGRGRA